MANFVQLLIGTTLILIFVCLVNVYSLPTDVTSTTVVSNVKIGVVDKLHEDLIIIDCSGHGQRSNDTGCDCDRGWITYEKEAEPNKYCAYQQRSTKTAFFLSLFAGIFGVDWFYLSRANFGYIIAGILKLLMGCGCCGAWPLTYFGPEIQNSESVKAKLRIVSTCFSLLAFAWWIVDWARILGHRFPDGNGKGLYPW